MKKFTAALILVCRGKVSGNRLTLLCPYMELYYGKSRSRQADQDSHHHASYRLYPGLKIRSQIPHPCLGGQG
jgi:hypothetical protein